MSDIRSILAKNHFQFNKRYGQNFITDPNLLTAIVEDAGIDSNDVVLEIGAGAGSLTMALAKKAKRVVSFEIDRNLEKSLTEITADFENIELFFQDIMKVKSEELTAIMAGEYKVVANLPYYITTPIVMRFVEEEIGVKSITVMVQEEVAQRFVAREGTKEYGAITPSIALCGNAEITRRVKRNMFFPMPNVDSAVVRIVMEDKHIDNLPTIRRVIKAGFSMRRKTLSNCLSSFFSISKEKLNPILEKGGFSPSIRGETLSYIEYAGLTDLLRKEGVL